MDKYAESPEGTIDYKIRTPMKLSGSVGGIIGKFGFVNAEVEYQDYSKGHMRIVSDNLYDKDVEEKIEEFAGKIRDMEWSVPEGEEI